MSQQADFAQACSSAIDLNQLPLILAGPILRRTTAEAVTVWIALQHPCQVELRVRITHDAGETIDRVVLQGCSTTVKLGQSLHVVAITATPLDAFNHPVPFQAQSTQSGSGSKVTQPDESRLEPGQLYAYELEFFRVNPGLEAYSALSLDSAHAISLQQALTSPRFPELSISYFSHGLPTFALCPARLDQLQLFHGSCRNVQDRDHDALAIVDCAAAYHAAHPNQRPHQLLFTGDQIYGDDVAEPFLWAILRAKEALFGDVETETLDAESFDLHQALQPGQRSQIATEAAGLTASFNGHSEKTSSHLFRFSEYCIAYLFSWSQCLWQLDFPRASDLGYRGKRGQRWDRDVSYLKRNCQSQPLVRRALANVPTYMIFDDHEVSDDWNLNQAWCQRVLGSSMGYQVVRNAMLAYTLFQGWGNTPEQFTTGAVGAELLKTAELWCGTGDRTAASTLARLLGLPPQKQLFRPDGDMLILNAAPASLKWHYDIEGTNHQIWVLDTRTQRGYPRDESPTAPPQLISPSAFQAQLEPLRSASYEQTQSDPTAPICLTFVVAPTNVFTLEILDWLQSLALKSNRVFGADVGDSWNLETSTRAKLLGCLFHVRRPVIILSGDIHFGASLEVDYQTNSPLGSPSPAEMLSPDSAIKGRLVQLTASALCNSDTLTGLLHTKLKSLLPERSRSWVGWNQPAVQVEVTATWQAHLQRQWLKLRQRFKSAQMLSSADQLQLCDRPPHWQYRTVWLQRQPAQRSPWLASRPYWLTSASGRSGLHSKLTQWLWYSRWLQEGHEVVGFNNIGLVHFEYYENEAELLLMHDLYWYSPWQSSQIIYSRFESQLKPL